MATWQAAIVEVPWSKPGPFFACRSGYFVCTRLILGGAIHSRLGQRFGGGRWRHLRLADPVVDRSSVRSSLRDGSTGRRGTHAGLTGRSAGGRLIHSQLDGRSAVGRIVPSRRIGRSSIRPRYADGSFRQHPSKAQVKASSKWRMRLMQEDEDRTGICQSFSG